MSLYLRIRIAINENGKSPVCTCMMHYPTQEREDALGSTSFQANIHPWKAKVMKWIFPLLTQLSIFAVQLAPSPGQRGQNGGQVDIFSGTAESNPGGQSNTHSHLGNIVPKLFFALNQKVG